MYIARKSALRVRGNSSGTWHNCATVCKRTLRVFGFTICSWNSLSSDQWLYPPCPVALPPRAVATTWTREANSGASAITVLPMSNRRSRTARQLNLSANPEPSPMSMSARPLMCSISCTTNAAEFFEVKAS